MADRGLVQGSQLGAEVVGLGNAEVRVEGEGVLPVPAGLIEVARRLVAGGDAVVGAGLLVANAALDGHGQRLGMLATGLLQVAGLLQGLSQAVERDCFTAAPIC